MSRRCCPCCFLLMSLALLLGYHFQAGAQEAKKDDSPKKEAKKDDAPKKDALKKDDAKKEEKKDDAPKKDASKKDEAKKDEIKEEPKKEPFVPDTPLKELKGHTDWINAVVISGDGKYIASASRDRTVKVWDVDAAKDVATLKGSPDNVKGVVFLDGSAKVISSTGKWNKEKKYWEGEIKIWDAKAGKEIKSIKGHAETIEGLAISKDGKLLASASEDQTVKIWDIASGKDIQTLKGHTGLVQAVVFTSDGRKLATASADKTVRIWDAASGKELASFKVEPPVKIPEPKAKETKDAPKKQEAKKDEAKKDEKKDEAKKKDDGKKKDEAKKKKDTAKKETKEEPKDLTRPFTCVAFSPDNKRLVAGNLDGVIKIYDVEAAKEVGELKAHEGVWALAYNVDGSQLASGGWDNTIKLWDPRSRNELSTIKAHNGTVTALSFSRDGRLIISGSIDGTVKIWNVPAAARAATLYRPITKNELQNKVPNFFYFDYAFEPEPGKRLWLRVGDKTWIERFPSGKEARFEILGRTTVDKTEGIVAEREDKGLLVFIADKSNDRMEIRFRQPGPEGSWSLLAEMKKVE